MTAPTALLLKAGSSKWVWITLGVIAVVVVIFFVGKSQGKKKNIIETAEAVKEATSKTTTPKDAGIDPTESSISNAELANATGDAQYFIELDDSLFTGSVDDNYTDRLATSRDIYALAVANAFKAKRGKKLSTFLEDLWYKDDSTELAIEKLRKLGM